MNNKPQSIVNIYTLGHKDGFNRKYGQSVNTNKLSDVDWLRYNDAYEFGKAEREAEDRM